MHISGLINRFSRLSTTFRIGLVISAVTLCLVGSIVFTVMKVRGAQAEIDTHRLTGKVFLIRAIPGKRYITVMNANGTDSRVLTDEFDFALDLIWYPKSGSLGILKVADDRLRAGDYTLSIHGQAARDVSVDKIERSIPDDFRTKFFDPTWEYKDGHCCVLVPDSRTYSTRITFSPDGKMIAGNVDVIDAASNKTKLRMCVVPADGSAPESCNQSVEGCRTQSPVWSPDGSKVVYSGAFREDAHPEVCNLSELYIADAAMENAFQLTNIDGPMITEESKWIVKPGIMPEYMHRSSHPRWSPDGQWIAFMSYGGIYRVHPDGTGLQLIIRDGYYPAWSPDGLMLMYVVKTGSPFAITGASDRIFVAHEDGSNPTEIPLDDKCSSKCAYEDLNWAE
ncbi:MAG: TolB family protein [Terracidiphilus sp.]